MNLNQLSRVTDRSVEELKDILYDEFGIIILSADMPLQQDIITKIVARFRPAVKLKADVGNKKRFCQLDEDFADTPSVSWTYTKKLLQYCVENKYLIFIDTCSLLTQSAFFQFYECLKTYAHVLYVPYVVTEELKRILFDHRRDEELQKRAEKALQFICKEEENGEIIFIGNENDKRNNEHGQKVIHADRVIIEKLNYYRNNARSSLFITQDHDVTVDVLKLNEWRSLESNALVLVKKLGKGGILEDNADDTVNPTLPID